MSDLFGEQVVLCGGVPALIKRAFEVLTKRGFSPEVAYFECLHELKIIVDIFTRSGFSGMRDVISKTAAYGGLKYGEALITDEMEQRMERLFDFLQDGSFARDWLKEARGGGASLDAMRESERESAIEKIGERVRRIFRPTDGK